MIVPDRFDDDRGYFVETYNRRAVEAHGLACEFVQDHQSYSAMRGTVRGLNFQIPPHAQSKLVRVVRGSILDACVGLRRSSPTFGSRPGGPPAASNATTVAVLRSSAFPWRLGPPGRDADRGQCEKSGLSMRGHPAPGSSERWSQ